MASTPAEAASRMRRSSVALKKAATSTTDVEGKKQSTNVLRNFCSKISDSEASRDFGFDVMVSGEADRNPLNKIRF